MSSVELNMKKKKYFRIDAKYVLCFNIRSEKIKDMFSMFCEYEF